MFHGSIARAYGAGGRLAPLVFFMLMFLCLAQRGAAQQISRFAVYAAKGEKFSISYDGQTRVYRPEPVPSGGITVQKKDLIKTGADSVVELRSYPPGITILIADKSSVLFESVAENSAYHVIAVIFGRIRVINSTTDQTVIVRAGRSLIETGVGDINIDYALYPWAEGQPSRTLVVSAMRGGAQVVVPQAANENGKKNGRDGEDAPPPARTALNEGELLYIDPVMGISEKRPLEVNQDMQAYWARKGYWAGGKLPTERYAAGYLPILSETRPPPKAVPPAKTVLEPIALPVDRMAESSAAPNWAANDGPPSPLIDRMPYTEEDPVKPAAASPKKKSKAGARALGISIGAVLIGGGAFMQYGLPAVVPDVADDRQLKNTMYVAGFIPIGLGLITVIGSLLQ